jgi:hypothetical protein
VAPVTWAQVRNPVRGSCATSLTASETKQADSQDVVLERNQLKELSFPVLASMEI